MKNLSMIIMLAFVCGSFAMAQTANPAKKANLLPDGTVITDLRTGEVVRTTGGTTEYVGPTGPIQVSLNGTSAGSGTTSKQTTPGNIGTAVLGTLSTSSQAPAAGVQSIKTPVGSITGNNGGNNLINATNQGPIGPGSGVTQKTINLTTPIPVNTSNQVEPQ